MVISDKTHKIEEFEAYAAAHPEQLLELIDGRIVEKVTSEEHGKKIRFPGAMSCPALR